MKFGLMLTAQHRPDEDVGAVLDGHLALLRAGRAAGWNSVWTGQHFVSEGLAGLQPMPLLARYAAESGDMTVGIGIHLLALHNPVAAVEDIATLDIITGGRLVYGAGLGYRDCEYAAFGLERKDGVRRFERNLDLVRRMLEGEELDIDLPGCRVTGYRQTLRTIQRPRPRIWLAANADSAVRRAALLADAWLINPHASLPVIARQLDLFRAAREEAGLPPPAEQPMMREVICAPTSQAAHALAARHLDAKYKSYLAWGQDKALPREDRTFGAA